MSRVLVAWVAVSLAVVGTGCTMCQHPYDYSGPVVCGGRPVPGNVRAGSILSCDQPPGPGEQAVVTGDAVSPTEAKGAGTIRPDGGASIVEQAPAGVEGRKTEERLPSEWRGGSPSAVPQTLFPLNGRPQ